MAIVREFYANAQETMNGFSFVRGIQVDYKPRAIRRVFNLPDPPAGRTNWVEAKRMETDLDVVITDLCIPGTQWTCTPGTNQPKTFSASTLNRYAKAWNLFVCTKLMPSSHQHEVTVEREIILWGIIVGKDMDVGHLINQNMLRYMRGSSTGSIPHASIVTHLCAKAGIRWTDEQLQYPSQDITHATIARFED